MCYLKHIFFSYSSQKCSSVILLTFIGFLYHSVKYLQTFLIFLQNRSVLNLSYIFFHPVSIRILKWITSCCISLFCFLFYLSLAFISQSSVYDACICTDRYGVWVIVPSKVVPLTQFHPSFPQKEPPCSLAKNWDLANFKACFIGSFVEFHRKRSTFFLIFWSRLVLWFEKC